MSEDHFVDRTGWPSGPWDDEPDKVEWWLDDPPGYLGLIMRNEMGALCGYVGLPPGHSGHGIPWSNNVVLSSMSVHGAVTYSGPYMTEGRVWWLVGFDCLHFQDDAPGMMMVAARVGRRLMLGEYRTIEYVRAEVVSLAVQLAAVDTPPAMELQATPKEEG